MSYFFGGLGSPSISEWPLYASAPLPVTLSLFFCVLTFVSPFVSLPQFLTLYLSPSVLPSVSPSVLSLLCVPPRSIRLVSPVSTHPICCKSSLFTLLHNLYLSPPLCAFPAMCLPFYLSPSVSLCLSPLSLSRSVSLFLPICPPLSLPRSLYHNLSICPMFLPSVSPPSILCPLLLFSLFQNEITRKSAPFLLLGSTKTP
jgi:hypothetical protein